jgi:hypothetical protein
MQELAWLEIGVATLHWLHQNGSHVAGVLLEYLD